MTKKALLTLESPMSANFTLGLSCSKLGILKMTSMISSASSEQEQEQEHQSGDVNTLKSREVSLNVGHQPGAVDDGDQGGSPSCGHKSVAVVLAFCHEV